MIDQILECIENFGPVPRQFSRWDRLTYLRLPTPSWARANPSDRLNLLFRNLPTLYREGVVVWGHIVQANVLMFEDGSDDLPGDIVYSLAKPSRVKPEYLEEVAEALFSLKGTEPEDPQLTSIAAQLTDEMTRSFGVPIPASVSPKVQCRMSTTFFVRKHLPNRRLCASLLPMIVNPRDPYLAVPLPEKYWPEGLVDLWSW